MSERVRHSGKFCDVCRRELAEDYEVYQSFEVLGDRVGLCAAHQKAWEELGPMATMVAYVMRKIAAREPQK